jgi:UDP-N-acetylmuramate-alanine ligase
MLPRLRRRVITYGLGQQAEVRADRIRQEGRTIAFRVWWKDEALGELRMAMPGRHNVRNALAATTVALELDIPFAQIQRTLEGFGNAAPSTSAAQMTSAAAASKPSSAYVSATCTRWQSKARAR